jgi:internalin A
MPVRPVSRPSRRYLWFGLRVLIILVLVLGYWLVRIFHLTQIQREAVAAIENGGGTVLYDWEWDNGHFVPAGQPRAPRWLVAQFGVDLFGHVTVAKACSLAQAGRLTGLQVLHVKPVGVFDYELESLKGLTILSKLDLRGNVRDAGLVHLKGLTNLSTLHLDHTPISDRELLHLEGLTNLSTLDLNSTQVGDAGLAHLEGLANLSTLHLKNTRVSDRGLTHLKGLTNLSTLSLDGTPVSGAGLAHLKGLTNLSTLDLSNTRVSDAGAIELMRALPGLKLPFR